MNQAQGKTPFGEVVAVCISPGGVPKQPVGEAEVTSEGLSGDGHNHEKHRAPHRAVCIQGIELLDDLRAEGFPVGPGIIGENLTVRGSFILTLYRHLCDWPTHSRHPRHHVDHRMEMLHSSGRHYVYAPTRWIIGQAGELPLPPVERLLADPELAGDLLDRRTGLGLPQRKKAICSSVNLDFFIRKLLPPEAGLMTEI